MRNYFSNGQRVSSIFEIATAFDEPRTDGKNYIDNRIGYFKNGYKNILPSEKKFTVKHPYLATRFFINRNKAIEAVKHFDGISNSYGDAIRHCYWCALNQMAAGLNSTLARELGNAHEENPKKIIQLQKLWICITTMLDTIWATKQ